MKTVIGQIKQVTKGKKTVILLITVLVLVASVLLPFLHPVPPG